MSIRSTVLEEAEYEAAVDRSLKRLKLENLMEAPAQAIQHEIPLESLALLVQYPNPNTGKPRVQQVVPDNRVVLWYSPLKIRRSFNRTEQSCGPFWVMEYVSKTNEHKGYEQSTPPHEHALKVSYVLLFSLRNRNLSLLPQRH